MNKTLLWIVVVIAIVIGMYFFFWSSATAPTIPDTNNSEASESATVTLSASGFSPATVTVRKGGSVTWVNEGNGEMWVASAQHPVHTAYSGTALAEHCTVAYTGPAPFDQCMAAMSGGSYTFAFEKAGEWKYHNHAGAEAFGTVVVQ